MKTLHDIPIFKAGRHRDMNGTTLTITEVDLDKIVSTYQPELHEAPLVIGHPEHDAPAWGWVSGLRIENNMLLAMVQQVDPAFSKIVKAGRYKKVSASFYTPEAANNPSPGNFYLRHVGFLGAQPPAIKGLGEASFNEKEDGIITFTNKITKTIEQGESSNFSDPKIKQETTMGQESKQLAPKKESLEKMQQELEKRTLELNKREEAIKLQERESKKNRQSQLVDQLIKDGKLLPRDREEVLALMDRLQESGVIEFSEGEGKPVSSEAAAYFQSFIKRLPVQVDFSENTTTTIDQNITPHYTTPRGYQVDQEGLTKHNKILAYAKSRDIDYLTAALSVGK
ncbi:MAG: hypothetical protein HQL70_10080 [Magnetococcales bacterium]|nr:hypothetical protein [Magnetococcales bacterium]